MPTKGKGSLIWEPNTTFYSNVLADGEPFVLSFRANCPHDPEMNGVIQIPSMGWTDLAKNYKFVKCYSSTLTAHVRGSLRTPIEKPDQPMQGYLFSAEFRMYAWCDSNITPHWATEADIQRLPGVKRYVFRSQPPVFQDGGLPGFVPSRTVTKKVKLECTAVAIDGALYQPNSGAGVMTPASYWSLTTASLASDMLPVMRVHYHMVCFTKGPDATWDVSITDLKINHKCIYSGRTDYGMLPLGVIDEPPFEEAGAEVDIPDFWDANRIEETLQPDGSIVTAVIPT